MDDCSFCFLSIEFHYTFSISYKILPYLNFMFIIIILFWSGLRFFVPALLLSILMPLFLPFSVCIFVLFRSCCSHARVFGKALVHEFPMSSRHTEWYLPFSRGEIVCLCRSFVSQNQIKLNMFVPWTCVAGPTARLAFYPAHIYI